MQVVDERALGGGSISGSVEYPNPMNKWYFLSYIIGCTLAFLFGSLSFFDKPYKALPGVLLFWSIGSFFLIGILWKEVIHRPLSATITDEGVLLKLIRGRTVSIRWSDILWVSASPGGEKDIDGVSGRGGGIKGNKGTFYQVTYEIGRDVKDRYYRINGRWPPNRLQYNENKRR